MGLIDGVFGRRRVQMIKSVDEYVAGKSYALPIEVADRFIARGYAAGAMSRGFTPAEIVELRGNPQVVSIGG